MEQTDRITELLARMWIECDPNRDSASADEILPDEICEGGTGEPKMASRPNPLAGKPRWHWFLPRAEATIAYLTKHGLEIREASPAGVAAQTGDVRVARARAGFGRTP